ncbi:PREDICTED: uncharacterized protein LOC106111891 isoform X2 [Papilio polytes]|uniref:uncharacterized protein LOC106111891 isoform X2 n=1 Tax=Papilio polytes TaxID=76194 RepID=UPI0006760AB8|nr:PREDICTED: uncharacterized protein LOC106111891 isoform X2 [Papilio polytes]XP_013149538.1 PREDICTED: uncharacterized protein LOC106111891 isoform X2 [Papilio polytes]
MSNRAWVTLATNDSYGLGALVLAHSLRRAGSAYPAVVLITPSVTDAMRDRLSAVFAEVVVVDVLDSGDAAHLALLQRPELGITFTKIHCWNLTQYEKCVFLDADTLVVQNCDELFEREELSAAPDVGWPDCFNSGVFVYRPSAETFASLITFAQERGSFDGGDQGLLNSYFSDWAHGDINKHLPFLYNVTSAAFYSYLPALKHYGQNLKIIHFIGAAKPWLQQFDWQSRSVDAPDHLRELLQQWWDLFVSQVHPLLDTTMVEVEDVPTTLALPEETFFTHSEQRSDYDYYKPILDPDSEFYWHRPEAQISDPEVIVPAIDMTQFHDPWDIYQGHIKPTEETKSNCSNQQDVEVIRNVWEQPSLRQFQNYTEPYHIPVHDTRNHEMYREQTQHYGTHRQETSHTELFSTEGQHNKRHHKEPQHHETYYNDNHAHVDSWHSEPNTEIYRENTTQHSWSQPHNTESYNNHNHYENKHYDGHQNEYCSYNKDIETHSNFSYKQQSLHHSEDSNYPNASSETYNQSNQEYYNLQISDPSQSHFAFQHEHQPSSDKNIPALVCPSMHQLEYSQSHQDINEPKFCNHECNVLHSHTNDQNSHFNGNSESQNIQMHMSHLQEQIEQFTHPLRKRMEYAYYVHLDHEKERNRQIEKLKDLATEKVPNGHGSESEIDGFEDFIVPRHPYDGFYLRHRTTIDSRGRKICTHEIPPPPSPSPSISPAESPVYFDAESEFSSPEDTYLDSDDREHSGVAGNLARVSPGDIGAQREALDELTRRQGWEAGNIDYMGADSFANIWAKISQTLSQPPALPPKEPTPPPVAAEAEATEVPQPAVSPAPAVEEPKTEIPVESEQSKEDLLDAVKPSKVEEPVAAVPPTEESAQLKSSETVPLATPEPSSEPPVETSPEESALPALPVSEDPKPSSLVTETISEEAKPSPQEAEPTSQSVEHSPQEAEPSPVEAVETPIAKETAPTTEALPEAASSEESTIAVETADIPVEPSVPETPEIPVPVVEAVLAEKETPAEEAVKIDEIPAPVIEASATEIPKSEAEPVAAVAPPQEQKTEEKVEDVITKVSEDAPAEATPVETPAATPETPVTATEATTPAATEAVPPKPADIPLTGATDSPPLANTPSKEDVTAEAAAKSTEEAAQETRL